jgi:hypothetical protein
MFLEYLDLLLELFYGSPASEPLPGQARDRVAL